MRLFKINSFFGITFAADACLTIGDSLIVLLTAMSTVTFIAAWLYAALIVR